MRTITSRQPEDKGKYILYHYVLDDGTEVDTPVKFEIGDRMEVWWDEKWNKIKMRRGHEK